MFNVIQWNMKYSIQMCIQILHSVLECRCLFLKVRLSLGLIKTRNNMTPLQVWQWGLLAGSEGTETVWKHAFGVSGLQKGLMETGSNTGSGDIWSRWTPVCMFVTGCIKSVPFLTSEGRCTWTSKQLSVCFLSHLSEIAHVVPGMGLLPPVLQTQLWFRAAGSS